MIGRRDLGDISLFRGMPAWCLDEIREKATHASHPAGTVVLREGGQRRGFFLILSGRALVFKSFGRRTQRQINTLAAGSWFGEMSLLDDEPPSATVVAAEALELLELKPEDFMAVLERHPSVTGPLLATLSRRIRRHEELGIRELADAQEAVILSLAKLAEFRDPETGAHLERIRHLCRMLAEAARDSPPFREEIDDDFLTMIFMSSPLHDIGKVGIPDNILLVPRRLTDAEFTVMKNHPAIGAAAVREAMGKIAGISFLSMGYEIALGHHEWVNGAGYPRGLAGDAIPLCARIMAIADVYDALRSDRVYRKGMTHEATKQILMDGNGTQFDSRLIELFLAREGDYSRVY